MTCVLWKQSVHSPLSPNPLPGPVKPTWSEVCLQSSAEDSGAFETSSVTVGPKTIHGLSQTRGEPVHRSVSDHSNVVSGEQETVNFTAWW